MSIINKSPRLLILLGIIATIPSLAHADDPRPAEPKTVVQIYDIRLWTAPVYDLSLDSSPHSAAFITPANIQDGTFDFAVTGQRYPSRVERVTPTRGERVDELARIVMNSVAPNTWSGNGNRSFGSVREIDDMLIVTQTPENQTQIAALLAQLKEAKGETVRTTAEWVILPRDQVSKILRSRDKDAKEKTAAPQVDAAALANLPATTPRFLAELICLNGQTISFVSGRERTVTVKQTPVTGDAVAAYQPLIGNSGSGIALQIHPMVDHPQKRVVMTLFSTFNDAETPGPPIPVRATATTQASSGQRVPTGESSGTYRALNSVVQEFRSTLRFPLGVPVLAGSMTLEPNSKNAEAKELILVLTVQAPE